MKIPNFSRIFNKISPLIMLLIFLGTIAVNLVLIFRSSPWMLSLGSIKKIFVGGSQVLIPFTYLLYIFMVMNLAKIHVRFSLRNVLPVLIFAVGLLVISSSLYFDYIEANNYPNYVFTRYHIYLPSLQFFATFQIIILSVWILVVTFSKKHRPVANTKLLVRVISILFVVSALFDTLSALPKVVKDELSTYRKFTETGGKIFMPDFGNYPMLLKFIKEYTEEDSTIIHPKQSDTFPTLGNQPLLRYQLFPRTLVSESYINDYLNKENSKKYVYFILSGAEPVKYNFRDDKAVIFPGRELKAKKIVILKESGSVKILDNTIFGKSLLRNIGNFKVGVIKVDANDI